MDPLVKAFKEHEDKNKKRCERCSKVEVPDPNTFYCTECLNNPLWPK